MIRHAGVHVYFPTFLTGHVQLYADFENDERAVRWATPYRRVHTEGCMTQQAFQPYVSYSCLRRPKLINPLN